MTTFVSNNPDNRVGPGRALTVVSDITPPASEHPRFRIRLTTSPVVGPAIFDFELNQTVGSFFTESLWGLLVNTQHVVRPRNSVSEDSPVEGTVTLVTDSNPTVDSGSIGIQQWTNESLYQLVAEAPQVTTGGGLTPAQAVQLDEVWTAVRKIIPALGGVGGLVSIIDALNHPAFPNLGRSTSCTPGLTGTGSLALPPASAPTAVGMFLTLDAVPPGFGRRNGQAIEYQERLGQFCATHRLKTMTRDVITELVDVHRDDFVWLWESARPLNILYDITPGVAMTACFLEGNFI